MKRIAAALLLGCLAISGASAQQPVYRCGNAYSQSPCPQGRVVDVADPRSQEQRVDARQLAGDEQQRALRMQRDRLTAQAATKPAGAGSLSALPAAAPASAGDRDRRTKKKRSVAGRNPATTDFRAIGPASGKDRVRR